MEVETRQVREILFAMKQSVNKRRLWEIVMAPAKIPAGISGRRSSNRSKKPATGLPISILTGT